MLSNDADHVLIVDTNVVLHRTDFLEHESIKDVVILNTVYREVQHKNSSVFLRLKNLLKNTEKRFYYFSNEYHKVGHLASLCSTLSCADVIPQLLCLAGNVRHSRERRITE